MRKNSGVSELQLEQYALGELQPADRERVQAALAADAALAARLAEIEASNAEILAAHPPQQVAEGIRERLRSQRFAARRGASVLRIALPAAAAVLVALGVIGVSQGAFPFLTGQDTRLKGGALHLSVFRKTDAGAEEMREGALANPREVLQIGYAAGEARYGVIFSIDGRGTLTFHLPRDYSGQTLKSPELERQGPAVLPYAYELDDAPGFERFFIVAGRTPFDVREVARAARALAGRPEAAERGGLSVAGGLTVQSFTVRKPR
jgi:hypothetical protein